MRRCRYWRARILVCFVAAALLLSFLLMPGLSRTWVWVALAALGLLQDPYEPNNSWDQAYGPLVSGEVYQGYIWPDAHADYFYLDAPSGGRLEASLENVPRNVTWFLTLFDSRPQLVTSQTTSNGAA